MVLKNIKKAPRLTLLLIILLLPLWDISDAARGFKRNFRNDPGEPFGIHKSLKNGGLFPSTFNVATKADIYVNATCGEDGPETFCKPSESARCAICDARSPDPGKRHNISNVLNPDPGKWWQSPTLARDTGFEHITIILDLKQVYQIENIIVKAANSPRPAAWVLERSIDGEEFRPWQYYAPSDEECWSRYSIPPVTKPIFNSDDEVICTSMYSRPTPVENGEIHTHLLNGRPGAQNHSEVLQEFTQARYVQLRFQGLHRSGGAIADKRRAFYSIKEISIGGRCLCSGHASRCRYSARHGHQECECERHTCGERCEKCCSMYNQVAWKPGTAGRGFHCEKCNCHGHANACRYDPEIAERRMSLDIRGKYRGGGVCINCSDHTTGINCDKCQVGYYRPHGVSPDDPNPCIPCDHCDLGGSTGFCTPDDTYPGKVAGACECKVGFSGYKCDQCAAGYRQFPDCIPCPCDSRGILPSHDCEGDCLCKANVGDEFCDRCKSGFFALTRDNLEGCLPCDCFGVTDQCTAAKLVYESISTLSDWRVTDINASRPVVPAVDPDNGWLILAAYEVEYQSPFWLAPKMYSGNRLSSYGSSLNYSTSWIVMRGDTSGKPTIEPNIILVGKNGMRIAFGEEQYNGHEAEISVLLQEQGWYHVHGEIHDISTRRRRTEYKGDPVTRSQMLKVLADVKHLMIRAQYHSEQVEASLLSVVLPIGERVEDGSESLVEHCKCPEGYAGLSCENCAWGYVKVVVNGTDHQDHHVCVKCDCNGHAESCNLVMGECNICEHHTTGPKCDRCALGYYGDATRGTPEDCKRCACPLFEPSNQFSPSCRRDDLKNPNSNYVCTQCPAGYIGDHCERCDVGYFGDPTKLSGSCKICPCNGGTCDQETGRCLECLGNTEGWKCDKCKEAHYGDPLEQNCLPCNCNIQGSSSGLCDTISGQCLCLPLFSGRDCSRCIEGYGNVSVGCRECDCDVGAVSSDCDPITGSCECMPGVVGDRCDQCDADHYGLSMNGCTDTICHEFSFERTDPMKVSWLMMGIWWSDFSMNPKSIPGDTYYDEEVETLFNHAVRNNLDLLKKSLGIKFHYYVPPKSVKIENYTVFMHDNVSIDLLTIQILMAYSNSYWHVSCDISQKYYVILSQSRGFSTPLEKIADFYGLWTLISLIIILTITFIVIWFKKGKNISFAVFDILRLLINQGVLVPINTLSLKIFFGMIFLYFLVIQSTFSGNLAGFLTKVEIRKSVDSIQDLKDPQVKTIVVYGFTFEDMKNPEILKKNIINVYNMPACTDYVSQMSGAVCVGIEPYIRETIFIHDPDKKKYYISKNKFSPTASGYAFRGRFPWEEQFNRALMTLTEIKAFNYIQETRTKYFEMTLLQKEIQSHVDFRAITLKDLEFAFFFLVFGNSVGIICFLFELLISRKCNIKLGKSKVKVINLRNNQIQKKKQRFKMTVFSKKN